MHQNFICRIQSVLPLVAADYFAKEIIESTIDGWHQSRNDAPQCLLTPDTNVAVFVDGTDRKWGLAEKYFSNNTLLLV